MYSTYEAPTFGEPENEAAPTDRRKIVILGGGPNRIGQGIEFDYCCCHACFALADAGFDVSDVHDDVLQVPLPLLRAALRGVARPLPTA